MSLKDSPVLKIYLPQKEVFNRTSAEFGYDYTKEELVKLVTKLRHPLLHHTIEVYDSKGYLTSSACVRAVMESVNQQKAILQDFAAIMYGDGRNLGIYLRSLPEQKQMVYKNLLRNGMCLMKEVKEMLGVDDSKDRRGYYSWGRPKLDLQFVDYLFGGYDDHYNSVYFVEVQPKYRRFLFEALLPDELSLVTTKELPQDMKEGCFELSTITHLPVITALMEQGVLVRGNNKFSAVSVKKGAKQLGIDEFFSGMGLPKQMENLRGSIMLQTMGVTWSHLTKSDKKKAELETYIRKLYSVMIDQADEFYPILMSHITGLRPTNYDQFYSEEMLDSLGAAASEWEVGEWIDVNSIVRRYFLSTTDVDCLNFVSTYFLERANIWNKFGDIEHKVTGDKMARELGIPFLKGLLFYMAAWGILDVACRDYDPDDLSPYDTLEYVRLTPLGAYVLEQTDTYEPPKVDAEVAYFELDPNRLIIRSLLTDNPYESLLTDTCTPIGNRRYKMTAESFLAHCSSKEDVKGKIDFFKRYISGDLSEVWTDFFKSLLKRCKPLTEEAVSNYLIYKISSDNERLIHLLSNDAVLRQLVIRAENFLFLVPKANKVKFDHRLKSLGYLL